MKILLKNCGNSYNYGTMMMAENLISFLVSNCKESFEFYIQDTTNDDIERYKIATSYDKIYIDNKTFLKLFTEKIKFVRHIERLIRNPINLKRIGKFYDAIFVLGGDDFSEIYYKFPKDNHILKDLFKELNIYNKYSKFFMIGQTIGPYTDERIPIVKKGFKNIKYIYSRDLETRKYMKEEFDKDIKSSSDLAFLNLNLQAKYDSDSNKILEKYNLKSKEYITFVSTGLIGAYCKDEINMIDSTYQLLKRIKKNYPNKKIVYLSHVVTQTTKYNDNYILDEINKKYSNYILKNMIVINKPILPVEARIILGNGIFTITCRMHAAVSTFQMGVPAICLSYSKKFKGVISDGLNCPELVIDAVSDDFWKFELVDEVLSKINYIEENYDKLIFHIKNEVKNCQNKTIQMLNEIVNIIDKER